MIEVPHEFDGTASELPFSYGQSSTGRWILFERSSNIAVILDPGIRLIYRFAERSKVWGDSINLVLPGYEITQEKEYHQQISARGPSLNELPEIPSNSPA